jgi:hypothetical protein
MEAAFLGGFGELAGGMEDLLAAAIAKGEREGQALTMARPGNDFAQMLYEGRGKHNLPSPNSLKTNPISYQPMLLLL